MIIINLNWIILVISIGIYIIYKLFLRTPYFKKIEQKWQEKIKKEKELTYRQKMYKDFSILAQFIDWLEQQLPNRHEKKIFWKRFIEEPNHRGKIVETFLKMIEPKQEENEQPK